MQYFIHSDDVERINVAPGITVRIISGHSQTMRLAEMAPHVVMPIHIHTDEMNRVGSSYRGEWNSLSMARR